MSAIKLELAWLLEHLARPERIKVPSLKLWTGQLEGWEVALACCGIGPQSARTALERLGAHIEFSRILHIGVCGALSVELDFCRPVLARRIFAAWEPGLEPIELDLPPADVFESLPPESRPVTGSFVTNALPVFTGRVRDFLRERFQADCVDMESWEVASFCRGRSLPLDVVKAVSDRADSSFVDSSRRYAAPAALAAQKTALELIRSRVA